MVTTIARRSDARATSFVVGRATATNERLAGALAAGGTSAVILPPLRVAAVARAGDLVLNRVDVLATLDGVEPGLDLLRYLRERGVAVVNEPDALLACHDKLSTALLLGVAGVPHPVTAHVRSDVAPVDLEPPFVLKPRFGSWGSDVQLCDSRAELVRRIRLAAERPWFRRHGALVQELVEPVGFDLRVIVSNGEVVGAVERVAAPGEWRTNVSLGGWRRTATPPAEASALAVRAAAAVGAGLVGVDLLPDGAGWRVLELNGAVDFTDDYALDGLDVFERAVAPFAVPVEFPAIVGSPLEGLRELV